jgi:hypothetical protein
MNMPTCTSHAPWTAEFGIYGWAVLSARGEEVAFIRQSIVHDGANTRLIASAPEMLAALELIFSNAGESPEWIRARIGPVIEKAIGESESLARKIKAKGNE